MIEITNIEYKERPREGGNIGAQPYRCVLFSVRLPEDSTVRFLVDQQAIRMLDAPAAKGAILRSNVEKIVVRKHSGTIFSVVCFIRHGLAHRARSRFLAMVQGASPAYPEEIGTSLQGFDADQIAELLRNLGYTVEVIAVSRAAEPAAH